MKNTTTLLVIYLAVTINCFSQEAIDLFILAGQSNAQGWAGEGAYYPQDTYNLDTQIRLNYTFIENTSSNGWTTMQPQAGRFNSGHFGPEVTFSRTLKNEGYNPAIFKYSLGGTTLYNDWKSPGNGGYYDDMVATLSTAITDLENQGHTVTIRGFIWIQGEYDANNDTYANAYKTNLTTLINAVRNTVASNPTLPILLGVDEQFPGIVYRPAVLNAHISAAQNDANIKFTSMYGLEKADVTHLTPNGLIAQGERIAASYKRIITGETPSAACTTTANGNSISSFIKPAWGQSFKPDCPGYLSQLTFKAATNLNTPLTVSIGNGADCNATLLHSQTLNNLVDDYNVVTFSPPLYLDQEHTYYLNISSNTNEPWQIYFSNYNQVTGLLRTATNGEAGDTCNTGFQDFDMDFSIEVTENTLNLNSIKKIINKTTLYPNPTQGIATLNLNNLKDVSIKVTDLKGVIIYNETNINTPKYTIDLSDYSSGIYMVKVAHEEQHKVFKLVLNY